jgi:outer membrane protein insertion porin family
MQVYEGKQARINNIIIKGNTKTNEHVIRREIRTKPGQLYNRSDIIRTHRELATLGYFDPEKIGVNPIPNPADGTVDIEYSVEEKPSDQIEISGGWGANMIVGTLGLVFNNFSSRNFFKKEAWRPLPSGDGQRLSVRAQSNGIYYQSYNFSFVEPWLGGRKPNSLSFSVFYTIQTNGYSKGNENRKSIYITGVSVGLGRRLKVPDDFFILEHELSFQRYNLNHWTSFLFEDGYSNNFSFLTRLSRNSVDQPIYPRTGSLFSLSLQITPPYSLFNGKDYSKLSDQEKYRWIEYHKWTFVASWFLRLVGDLVLNTKAQFGFLGYFNKDARSPFEGYNLGGDGLSGYNLYGRETVGLRGYENGSLTPDLGGNIYNKLTMELRYPISLNPSATLYALTFLEGGNAWYDFTDYNPFGIKRSAGLGVRIFLPMFGMLGVDWGYGFDEIKGSPGANKGQFHFVIGQQF